MKKALFILAASALISTATAAPNTPTGAAYRVKVELQKQFPQNRPILMVAYGHSVPSGYFATPVVRTFDSYPHLFHKALAERYPHAYISVITASKGSEESPSGAARFERDVLSHRPDIITIDYGLNDVRVGLQAAWAAWASMIEKAQASGAMVILLTPTRRLGEPPELAQHAQQIRNLGLFYGVPVADSYEAWSRHGNIPALLSSVNHPNRAGHELVAAELLRASGLSGFSYPKPSRRPTAKPKTIKRPYTHPRRYGLSR